MNLIFQMWYILGLVSWICSILIFSHAYAFESLIDLSHELNSNSQVWPQQHASSFNLTKLRDRPRGNFAFAANYFCSPEHVGTHVDAPSHFNEEGWSLEEIPLDHLVVPGVVIDIREKVKNNSIYELTAADVVEEVNSNGLFPNNSLILVLTGWSNRYNDRVSYFGHESNATKLIFPGVSVGAVQILHGYREVSGIHIVGIGIDTPSLDYGPSVDFEAHQTNAAENCYNIVNLNNLEKLPLRGAEMIVMPMKITGGTGAPARVIALVDSSPEQTCVTSSTSRLAATVASLFAAGIHVVRNSARKVTGYIWPF